MKSKKISTGDFLYHPVHGMCRIDRLIQENRSGQKAVSYSLVPKIAKGMKVRFVIAAEQMEESGFHGPVSVKEAGDILDYLKAGDSTAPQTRQTWMLAQTLLSFSFGEFPAREQKRRQILAYSAKGLTGEFACVFNVTLREASDMIRKSLGELSKINLPVIAALADAAED